MRVSRAALLGKGQATLPGTTPVPATRAPRAPVAPIGPAPDLGRTVLAVDPANTCGWAVYQAGRLVSSGSVKGVDRQGGAKGVDVLGCWAVFRPLRDPAAPGVLVVEEQHPMPPPRAKSSPGEERDDDGEDKAAAVQMRGMTALLREVEARQTWETFAVLHGWTIVRVHPMSWQCAALSRRRGDRRADLKRRSIERAKLLGARPVDDNEADAVCIARWYLDGGRPPVKKPVRKPAGA